MSKVGKVLGEVAESAAKATGIVTSKGGEKIGDLGKSMGMSDYKCEKVENTAGRLGNQMYYGSEEVKNKVESFTNQVEEGTKKTYHSIKNKIK
ncbi:MAG: hypothetical protein Q4F05_10785 [bacterium]|nr:hypothetical protein [bacterium]